jgi:hypothetical protein
MTEDERVCPKSERVYFSLCNQGTCMNNAVGDTGYCKRHASMEYARTVKIIRRIVVWGIAFLIGPPAVLIIGGLLWKWAVEVVFS